MKPRPLQRNRNRESPPAQVFQSRPTFHLTVALLLLAAFAPGCGYSSPGKPLRYPTAVVTGRVTAFGAPVEGGWITFMPVGPTVGDHVIARIDGEGRYTASTAVGPHQVRVRLTAEFAEQLKRRTSGLEGRLHLLRGPASRLRTTIAPGENRYDIDVVTTPFSER